MNDNTRDGRPLSTPQATEPGVNSQTRSLGQLQRVLLEEILALAQSGENPARLQELMAAHKTLRVARIDKILAQEREQRLPRLLDQRNTFLDAMQPLVETLSRPDLTYPELIRLWKLAQQNCQLLLKSLAAEKELIQQTDSQDTGTGRRRAH